MPDQERPAGRPKENRITDALLETALEELAEKGYEAMTIGSLAARVHTSKQAVYRRWNDKAALAAAAIRHALAQANPAPPQRGSVARDLETALTNTVTALQDTPLGSAIRALIPLRDHPDLRDVLSEAEDARRLLLRQIFIATPFEAEMETRIDLLLGLIYFNHHIRARQVTPEMIGSAIHLVLGLTAPKAPAPRAAVARP
ncbi:TetR/AcrR family transcriptional regulator [Roseibium litorale]|uniref:TetR/AcrR family transcriptional regulator n=1 Tax=Roseibium litorale TaxID=2803841 RepID=A0ABR9CGR9_9HYPH|nr:TetR/AcrR family transcriptional regulator [Roseibium litorale]MBD8890072.1 TetR/AcrR family transcriptional regulator [Roseibium litorale]